MNAFTPLLPKTSSFVWLTLDELNSAPLRQAAAYWNEVRGDRPFPAREELKARCMAPLLPYISLVKVIDGGADFLHRVVGDVVVRAFSVPIQNRRFSEIAVDAPRLIEITYGLFRKVVETKAPLGYRQITGRDSSHIVYTEAEMVLLPLGKDASTVDHIAGFAVHTASVKPLTTA